MLKIAVFGFYSLDHSHAAPSQRDPHLSPVTTDAFMQHVWEMEPSEKRIGSAPDGPCFVKLTTVTRQPVYVQALGEQMAQGVGLLKADGYIIIIDALKILAPRAIQITLRRLAVAQPGADVVIAAGRQNEPEALSSEDLRDVLGLHPDLPVMPFVAGEPKTVHRLVRRLVRYIDNPDRVPPPIFAGDHAPAGPDAVAHADEATAAEAPASTAPRIVGLDHVALAVSDLARALAFYQGVLGFRLLGQIDAGQTPGDVTVAHLDTGRGLLALVERPSAARQAPPGTAAAIALRVIHLDTLVAALARSRVPVVRQPVSTAWGVRVASVTDPDGTLIELIEGDVIYSRR